MSCLASARAEFSPLLRFSLSFRHNQKQVLHQCRLLLFFSTSRIQQQTVLLLKFGFILEEGRKEGKITLSFAISNIDVVVFLMCGRGKGGGGWMGGGTNCPERCHQGGCFLLSFHRQKHNIRLVAPRRSVRHKPDPTHLHHPIFSK